MSEGKLEALENRLDILQQLLEKALVEKTAIGDWISEKQVRQLTGLGRTTLRNLRQEGRVRCSTIAGKAIWYRLSDIEKMLNENIE
jgi:hypothetical protein